MELEEAGERPGAPGARGLDGEPGLRLWFFQLHQFSLIKDITSPYQPYLSPEPVEIAASPFGRQSRRGSQTQFLLQRNQKRVKLPIWISNQAPLKRASDPPHLPAPCPPALSKSFLLGIASPISSTHLGFLGIPLQVRMESWTTGRATLGVLILCHHKPNRSWGIKCRRVRRISSRAGNGGKTLRVLWG